MKHTVKAHIFWVPADAGGRKAPPTGPRYSTVARFKSDKANQNEQAWSIIAEFLPQQNQHTSCTLANIRFLAPNAPTYLLSLGNQFEFLEGHRVVARGKIVLDRDFVSDALLWEALPLKNGIAKTRSKTLVTA